MDSIEQRKAPSPEELERREATALQVAVANIVREERAQWQAEMAADLESFKAPAVERTPEVEILNRNGEAVHRLRSPREPQYLRMSEAEREWRSPDADHWYREFIVGQFRRDQGRCLRAHAELEGIFGRATTTEGAAAASGALSTGTGASLIPRPLENVILIARDRVAKMRRFAQTITMTAQTHTVPTAGSMTAAMTAESTTAAQGEPTISNVQLTARKGQVTAVATMEVLEDAAINLVNLYATRAGGALGVLEDNQFFKEGNGTAPNISAFLQGSTFNETTSTYLAFVDVLGMYYGVDQVYRPQSVWFASSDVLQFLAALKDSNGRQFYTGLGETPGAITDDPQQEGTIMRRPVYEVPFTAGTIWFGDPKASYVIGSRAGITSSASEHIKFDLDQVMWKWTQRFDGINTGDTGAQENCTGITSATTDSA